MKELTEFGAGFFDETGELMQVSFSLYQVVLHFERMTIDIQQSCEIACPEGRRWVWQEEERDREQRTGEPRMSDMTGFAKLLESEIERHEVLPGGKLRLVFSNGCVLLLWDHDNGYESFTVEKKGEGLIVI